MTTIPFAGLTREERRVEHIYKKSDVPTDPSTVTKDTPLESLNLNWREKDLPENLRTKHVHRLHPYLGKYIPQLVEIFLRKFFEPGQTVLDPFCGSGTTLVQANELGINSIGYDISSFNVLLTQAKIEKYNVKLVREELLDIAESISHLNPLTKGQRSLWAEVKEHLSLTDIDTEYLKAWFAPLAIMELMTYRRLIDTRPYKYKDLMKIILCRSARSSRMTTHFELDFPKVPQKEPYYCYKHRRQCEPTQEAGKFIRRYTIDTARRIEDFEKIRSKAKATVLHGDSKKARIRKSDGLITSPPYVGLIDYHEQHAYAYHLLGLNDRRDEEIGAAVNGVRPEARAQYVADIVAVFKNSMKGMPSGAPIIVVAADRRGLYSDIAKQLGVEIESVVERHVNRRTGMRSNEFFESVFIWRKP
jgi:hypothetical protein